MSSAPLSEKPRLTAWSVSAKHPAQGWQKDPEQGSGSTPNRGDEGPRTGVIGGPRTGANILQEFLAAGS